MLIFGAITIAPTIITYALEISSLCTCCITVALLVKYCSRFSLWQPMALSATWLNCMEKLELRDDWLTKMLTDPQIDILAKQWLIYLLCCALHRIDGASQDLTNTDKKKCYLMSWCSIGQQEKGQSVIPLLPCALKRPSSYVPSLFPHDVLSCHSLANKERWSASCSFWGTVTLPAGVMTQSSDLGHLECPSGSHMSRRNWSLEHCCCLMPLA